MGQLWSEGVGEAYVKRRASEMLEFLNDRRMLEDDRWATTEELCKNLLMTEYTVWGILYYLWAYKNQISVKEGSDGKLLASVIWDNDYPDWKPREVTPRSDTDQPE